MEHVKSSVKEWGVYPHMNSSCSCGFYNKHNNVHMSSNLDNLDNLSGYGYLHPSMCSLVMLL